MTLEEVEQITGKSFWKGEYCYPYGFIRTEEQYNYAKLFAKNTNIDWSCMSSFDKETGKYLALRCYLACKEGKYRLQFYTLDKNLAESINKTSNFTYGKYGKIDFKS